MNWELVRGGGGIPWVLEVCWLRHRMAKTSRREKRVFVCTHTLYLYVIVFVNTVLIFTLFRNVIFSKM
jgi:hypothetical protein